MKKHQILKLVILITVALFSQALTGQKAVLKFAINSGSYTIGEPGQIVQLINTSPNLGELTVRLPDGTVHTIADYYTVPYDSQFTVSWAYGQITKPTYSAGLEGIRQENNHKYLLARNAVKLFPAHPLNEEISALLYDLALDCERCEEGGEGGVSRERSISALKEYIRKFPNGRHRERFEFELFEIQNTPYEYEGSVSLLLSQAKLYEQYLADHPNHKETDEIRYSIARFYRMAAESASFSRGAQSPSLQSEQPAMVQAKRLLQELLGCRTLQIREKARVDLYNMQNNRRTYVNSNEW